MSKKSLKKNYIYNLAYQVLILILPLITAPYISRVLGAENIGIFSYTISISAYFILFGSLGIALYGKREIAYNQRDKKKCSIIFWEINLLRIITMLVSLIIFYFVFVSDGQYNVYYKVLILELIGNCIDISWFFQGLEEFKKTVIRNMLVKLVSLICVFLFVKTPDDLIIYFLIYVASILVGNASLWLYLPKFINKVKLKELKLLRHIKPTLSLFIPQIAIEIYTLLDRTMVGTIIADKSEVGFYDQSQKIIKVLIAIITSLGTVMMPRIASSFANGEKEKIQNYMKKSFNMIFLIAFPMIFGIISVSKAFVPVFFGDGYDKVAILMSIICPILLLIGLSNVTGTQYLLPAKRQKEFTISVVCGAIINFICNSFLIIKLGAIGASIGTIIAELTVTSVQIYFVRKDFHMITILKSCIKYLVASVIMFGVCMFTGSLVQGNVMKIVVQVTSGMLIYAICLLIMRDKFVFEILQEMKEKITVKFKRK